MTARGDHIVVVSEKMLLRANIGRRYWRADLAQLPDRAPSTRILRRYVETLEENRLEGWGLFIYGANGVGKTHASVAILKEYLKRGYSCYRIPADELKVVYIENKPFDGKESVASGVETVDVLLLDDLGKEYSGRGSKWAELCLENMMRKRNQDNKVTIFTSNLSPSDMGERYGPSTASLFKEAALVIDYRGPNFRDRAASKRLEEMMQ